MWTETVSVPSAQLADDGLGGGDVAGTAKVGFDYQVQNWVAGVFGLVDLGTNGNVTLTVSANSGAGAFSSQVAAVDWSWTAGGRLGYLIAPDALVYGLAGYTTTSFHPIFYNLGVGFTGTASMTDMHGITFGGGFEKLLTDAISASVEYRNTRLDTLTGFTSAGFTSSQAQANINSLRVAVAYRLATMK
jgi:outer membrane immunogenic protein